MTIAYRQLIHSDTQRRVIDTGRVVICYLLPLLKKSNFNYFKAENYLYTKLYRYYKIYNFEFASLAFSAFSKTAM